MTNLLAALGIPQAAAKFLAYLIGCLAICGAVYGAYCWAWDQGRDFERSRWERAAEAAKAKRQEQADLASTSDASASTGAETVIEARRKDLDNATANIPDQDLTPRQRARRDAELRRQGR